MIKVIEKDGDILIIDVETGREIMLISSVADDEINNLFFYTKGVPFITSVIKPEGDVIYELLFRKR